MSIQKVFSKKSAFYFLYFIIFLMILIAARASTTYVTMDIDKRYEKGRFFYDDHIAETQMKEHSDNMFRTLSHSLTGTAFLILCCFQFSSRMRTAYPRVHRYTGRVLVVLGFFLLLTAIRMALYAAYSGWQEAVPNIFYGCLFFFFVCTGAYHARKKNYVLHREYMIRAIALPLAAGAQIRIMLLIFDWYLNIPAVECLPTIFWMSFTGHYFVAEIYIKLSREKNAEKAEVFSKAQSVPAAAPVPATPQNLATT